VKLNQFAIISKFIDRQRASIVTDRFLFLSRHVNKYVHADVHLHMYNVHACQFIIPLNKM